ncbi:hypothetical protein POSPLADRAFT_1032471 [Postia placenta MAD-698-R-SB12]|uniref:Uncharacterized protein n=1 Tax=Postia placenta MAD-698-R-SB12 TaxID=670580 RepID=A0A1X6N656_9APHY|nr:hypothetical protein POSPLADRAFT_1032471 [Postia placenta MAD-698-R-SB12]OSX63976.1 hypothetical protein POSPLADRAFT_1032471 [Postia placenta MAD-698-R-SB12]
MPLRRLNAVGDPRRWQEFQFMAAIVQNLDSQRWNTIKLKMHSPLPDASTSIIPWATVPEDLRVKSCISKIPDVSSHVQSAVTLAKSLVSGSLAYAASSVLAYTNEESQLIIPLGLYHREELTRADWQVQYHRNLAIVEGAIYELASQASKREPAVRIGMTDCGKHRKMEEAIMHIKCYMNWRKMKIIVEILQKQNSTTDRVCYQCR